MTRPSDVCKAAGLSGLRELSELTGQSQQTLINWHRDKPELFAIVVKGAYQSRKPIVKREVAA